MNEQPNKTEGQAESKQDTPLEPHVSTAILVTDDDEDDEHNQKIEDGPGNELQKQNKTEEAPLKNEHLLSLIDIKDLHTHYSTHFEHVLEKIIKHVSKM